MDENEKFATYKEFGKMLREVIVLLRLNELVVKVNVILPALFQLPCGQQAIQEQCVECVCRIEIIGLSGIRRV